MTGIINLTNWGFCQGDEGHIGMGILTYGFWGLGDEMELFD